jgi:acid phosphatase type 7
MLRRDTTAPVVFCLVPLLLALALGIACSGAPTAPTRDLPGSDAPGSGAPPPPGTAPEPPVTFVGAGDIARCGHPGSELTARLLDAIPGTVFTTGDNAYDRGTEREFRECYGPTWGRHRDRTYPTPGNHEYETPGALPYYDYFGSQAGPRGLGYYAYRLGAWEVFSLNSNVAAGPGSPQYQWLAAELTRRPSRCSLAYWHHPVISEGYYYGRSDGMLAIWRLLVDHGTDVVLTGHDHNYQRFRLLGPELQPDERRGIRQFVVGTGGTDTYRFKAAPTQTEARGADLGVLRLLLASDSYEWEFVPVAGATFRDSGREACH